MKLSVIQNAFENVKKFSQEKLVEKYTNGVPEAIQKRFQKTQTVSMILRFSAACQKRQKRVIRL